MCSQAQLILSGDVLASKHGTSVPIMRESKSSTRWIRFRVDEFEALADKRGHLTDAARALFLEVDASNYSRISRGETRPSQQFIAAVLTAFADDPEINFKRLFEVVEEAVSA